MDEGLNERKQGQMFKGMSRGRGNRVQEGDAKGRP